MPPVALIVAVPVFDPKQFTFACDEIATVGPPVEEIFVVANAMQPFASVTKTELLPADKLVAPAEVSPLGIQL